MGLQVPFAPYLLVFRETQTNKVDKTKNKKINKTRARAQSTREGRAVRNEGGKSSEEKIRASLRPSLSFTHYLHNLTPPRVAFSRVCLFDCRARLSAVDCKGGT